MADRLRKNHNPNPGNTVLRPYKFVPEKQAQYLRHRFNGVGHIEASKRVGVHPNTVTRFIAGNPDFREEVRLARRKMVETAETQLFAAVEAGEPWAIKQVLDKFVEAKDDWGDRKDVNVTVNGSIEHVQGLPPAERVLELLRRMEERKALASGEDIIEGEIVED